MLMREKKRVEKIANEIREELRRLYSIAERAKVIAEIETREGKVQEILETATKESLPYKLNETCAALDEAFFAWEQVLSEEKKLTQLEEAIAKLKSRISRTKKRASALRNIVIPTYEKRVKFISERLEEHERDEMIRLKTARLWIF